MLAPWWTGGVGTAGFMLIGMQWLVNDMLALRGVAIAGSGAMILYNLVAAGRPLWIPVCANIIFVTINAIQIARLIQDGQEIALTEPEERLWDSTFHQHLTKQQVRSLLASGSFESRQAGELLVRDSEASPDIIIIVSGEAAVMVGGRCVATLTKGDFVGEMTFLLKDSSRPKAVVVATTDVSFIRWDRPSLQAFVEDQPPIHDALSGIWSQQLVHRLRDVTDLVNGRSERRPEEKMQMEEVRCCFSSQCDAVRTFDTDFFNFKEAFINFKRTVEAKAHAHNLAVQQQNAQLNEFKERLHELESEINKMNMEKMNSLITQKITQ